MKCDIRCFAFPDCYIMDRIAILLVLLTEGNYSISNSTRTYAYYDRLNNQFMQFNLHIKIVFESKYVRIYETTLFWQLALMNSSHL